ncbi:MAG TPA: hypothetical protein VE220_01430 [Gaiellaceae bacterium]|jgi:hypothetical protein|nr:hypothetical protein [Gaiellaceae bacterium]
MSPLLDEPAISIFVRDHDEPGIEVRVNFGVFAGRHATPAEIDELAVSLGDFLPSFAIVSEERHEFADAVEASVHQVVVEVPQEHAGGEPALLAERIVLTANGWALECIASRHGTGEL